MQIGLITDSLSHLPFAEVLATARDHGLSSVEIPTGNWSQAPHCDLAGLLASAGAREEFLGTIHAHGLTLSALNANGNQLHPVTGPTHDEVVRGTVELAGLLGVPTVVLMSGLPGGTAGDRTANWVTTAWPPENLAVLRYQWEEVALPYWRGLGEFTRDHGVRLAVEACGAQLVHDVAGLLRLIETVGPDVVGANLDPSHLMWMGADIPSVIRALGSAIVHVHAKDVRVMPPAARKGLLDTVPVTAPADRAWNYVTLGLGHPRGAAFWADVVYELRAVGFDGTLSIEHEDALVSAREGVRRAADLLKQVALTETPDWTPAEI